MSSLLLAAGEDADIDDIDAGTLEEADIDDAEEIGDMAVGAKPRPAGKKGATTVKVGLGFATPGSSSIGSASGSRLPNYADVWSQGTALDIVGEFLGGKVYAQFSSSSYEGLRYTNPTDGNDSYLLSDTAISYIGGGARFGGMYYGKVGLGLVMWPEISRIDYFSGYAEPVLEASTGLAVALGGGAEFKIGPLKAYADLEYTIMPAPESAENAVVFWPNFEAEGMNVLSLKTGVGIAF